MHFYKCIVISFVSIILLQAILNHAALVTPFFENPSLVYNCIFGSYLLAFLVGYISLGWYFVHLKKNFLGYAVFALTTIVCMQFFGKAFNEYYYDSKTFYLTIELIMGLKCFIAISVLYSDRTLWLKLFAVAVLVDLACSVFIFFSSFSPEILFEITEAIPHICLVVFFSREGNVLPEKLKAFFSGKRIS